MGKFAQRLVAKKNKEAILDFIRTRGRRPKQYEPKEKALYRQLIHYSRPYNTSYDPAFAAKVEAIAPTRRWGVAERKQEILAFIEEHGRRPNQNSKDKTESRLGWCLTNFTYESRAYGAVYDKKFAMLIDRLVPTNAEYRYRTVKGKVLKNLDDFVSKSGDMPAFTEKDIEQCRLAHRLHSHRRRDEVFDDYIEEIYEAG